MNTISSNQSDPKSRGEFAALAVIDDAALEKISGGLPAPDQDITNFPRWLWPLIRPANLVSAQPQPQPSLVTDNLNVSIANMVNR